MTQQSFTSPMPGAEPLGHYPFLSVSSVIRLLKKDFHRRLHNHYDGKTIHEFKLIKIDKCNKILHLWIAKKNRKKTATIIKILSVYSLGFSGMGIHEHKNFYRIKYVIEIDPKESPRGINLLN